MGFSLLNIYVYRLTVSVGNLSLGLIWFALNHLLGVIGGIVCDHITDSGVYARIHAVLGYAGMNTGDSVLVKKN